MMRSKRYILPIFIGLITLGAVVVAQEGRPPVRLKVASNVVAIPDSIIHLHQIAEIECEQVGVASRIGAIDIDEFSSAETELSISSGQLGIRLRLAGYRPSDFEIVGPSSVKVIKASHVKANHVGANQVGANQVSADKARAVELRARHLNAVKLATVKAFDPESELADILRRNLLKEYSIAGTDLHVDVEQVTNFPADVTGWDSLKIAPIGRAELPLGNQLFTGMVDTKAKSEVVFRIRAKVSVYRDFAVATEDIPSGTELTVENLKSERRLVSTRTTSGSFLTYLNALGKTTTKDLEKYSLLKPSCVSRIKASEKVLIKRNSLIKVTARVGNLSVGFKNIKALTDGALGQRIEFIHPRTKERTTARVLDAYTALID
ncbi:MAG: flagella basal body P-ring formation protein FlgA [Mariniblastus sp.]